MAALQPIITDVGLQAVFTLQSVGLEAEIAAVALGDGTYTAAEIDPNTGILYNATKLRREKARFTVAGGERTGPHTISIAAVADGATEFWIKEVGIILTDGTLLAIAAFSSRPLAYKSATVPLHLVFDLMLSALPANSVTIIASAPSLNLTVAEPLAQIGTAQTDMARKQLDMEYRLAVIEGIL